MSRGDGVADTKDQIVAVAMRHFAANGYASTSLNVIADEVGIRRPSVLHHFPTKEALYRAVIADSFTDWFALVKEATGDVEPGWPQVEKVVRAAFHFFEDRAEFVRLVRREAIDDGPILTMELMSGVRPLFDDARLWLEGEMDAGRLRRYDAAQLLITGYGAVLSYLSDAALIKALVGGEPLSTKSLQARREHVISVLKYALEVTPE